MRPISPEPRSARRLVGVVVLGAVAVAMGACSGGNPAHESAESSSDALMVCAPGGTVQGMDVSHYDGAIDWPTAKANGIDFAFVKATEGATYVDTTFASNWAAMKAAG